MKRKRNFPTRDLRNHLRDFGKKIRRVSMASDAPSWADQWGAGGIGAMEDENVTAKKENGSKKKKSEGKGGFNKAKTATLMGAKKFKLGVFKGIGWVKNKCQKKGSSK